MDNFVVSARKYRPATFATVIGQGAITTTLQNAIRNKTLAQAFLFCGPRGVGKTTCARIVAKTINCENLSAETEACNSCESCLSFNRGNSFNIYEMDGASKNSVDDMRTLTDQVRVPPHEGKFKIYIIDEVHMLSASAFNAFLKTLEEPPPHAIFILATTEKHKIIPTILSRCQIYDFNRIKLEDIANHLKYVAQQEGVNAEEEALHLIAVKADGALRDSLSIFDQLVSFTGNKVTYEKVLENLNILDYEYYFRFTNHIIAGDVHGCLLLLNEILDKGFDGHNFISGLSGHFRNLLMCRNTATLPLLEVSQAAREKYKVQAAQLNAELLFSILDISVTCDLEYKNSRNARLLVELALMKMCLKARGLNMDRTTSVPEKKNDVAISLQSPELVKANTVLPPVASEEIVATQKEEIPKEIKPQPTPAKSSPGTFSIRAKVSAEKKENKVDIPTIPNNADPFTQEQLESAWINYAGLMDQVGKKSFHASLIARKPLLKENFQIDFEVENKANFTADKAELIQFLRKELNNYTLDLNVLLSTPVVDTSTPYTTTAKYEEMLKKNPALDKLKNAFDLKIEF